MSIESSSPAAPVTIVTGAGSGIGLATARRLAAAGHRLALVGRTLSKLRDAAGSIREAHPDVEIEVLEADLGDPAAARSVIPRAVARFGRIDHLVNAAGIAPLAPIETTDLGLLERTFAVNTFGPALLIAAAWPLMSRQRSGCVVNVSTIGTSDPFAGFFAYAASKSALDSLTRSVANEGRRHGIRAFAVNPGAVETPLLRMNFPEKTIPHARTLSPEAVAATIVECLEGKRTEPSGTCIPMPSP
ncbi:MAG: SDR family NAD(P)-dependent oxidoreductase [Phycisphaerales bacterium]|jgi:NAD(P)-dependent dehydrogenase (short-subunit alcohol dehydrogenase family)